MKMSTLKLILVLTFLLALSFPLQVYASDDDEKNVNLMDLPKQLTERLGLPTSGDYFVGKILTSCIFLVLFLFPTMFLCAKFERSVLFPSLLVGISTLGFCVAIGWLPIWLFIIIILLIALMYAQQISAVLGGRG